MLDIDVAALLRCCVARVRTTQVAAAGGHSGLPLTCSFALAKPFAGHSELTPCVPFPCRCPFRAAGGRVKDLAYDPAASGGAAGVLDAGYRAPIIRAAGKGHAAAGCAVWLWRPHGRLAAGQARGCIHPFACPRHACRGAWGGYAADRTGSITRAPALPAGGGRCPTGAVRCTASRPAAGPVQVMRPVPAWRRDGCARRACRSHQWMSPSIGRICRLFPILNSRFERFAAQPAR